jgi:hypothetical protein
VRVEVNVRKEDAHLVRGLAVALSNPLRETEARLLKIGLKALLSSAPLDGIELDRSRDLGRKTDL